MSKATANLQIREALPQDNEQIRALLRQVAVVTPGESYRLEREPDAFALMRFQGMKAHLLVAAEGERILGMISVAIDRVWLDGQVRDIAYSSEMRVLPAARGRGLGEKLQRASLEASCNAAGESVPLFNTVMRANPVGMRMNHYLAEAGLAPVVEIADVVTCFWPTWLNKVPTRQTAQFRQANTHDLPAMAALWETFASQRQLARSYDQTAWQAGQRLPPLSAQNWVLALQGDEIQGFVGIWDQRSLRQVQLIHPSPLLRLLGWRPGQAMPVGHCFHLCLRPTSRRLLPGLLQQALYKASTQGLALLSLALDAQDPLLEWLPKHLVSLGSFGRMHLCSNEMPRRPRAFHLEMALG